MRNVLACKTVLQTVATRSESFGNKNSTVQSMLVRTKSQLVRFKVRNVLSFSPLFMLNRSPLVGKISGCT
uniref:Putative ovule protein n=1 Tax=Solanum chacoense TaxID=4108 RepID=A0A0V0GSL8_SOLCH